MRREASSPRRLGLLVIVAGGLLGFAAEAQDVSTILRRYVEQSVRAEFAGVQIISDHQTDGQRVSLKAIRLERAGAERIKYDENRFYAGTISGEQDGYRFVYIPHEKRLYKFPGVWTAEQRSDFQRRRLGFFDIKYEGTETVAGRQAHKLALVPKGNFPGPRGTLWIDTEKFVSLRNRLTWGETVLHDYRYERVRFREVTDEEMRFAPPEGTTVITLAPPRSRPPGGRRGDRAGEQPPPVAEPMPYASAEAFRRTTGVRPMILRRLPEGFRLQGFAHHPPEFDGVLRRRVSVRYGKDNQILLLTMGGMFGDGPTSETPREVKPKVFFWRRGSVRLALVGPREVPSQLLRSCADSTDWAD